MGLSITTVLGAVAAAAGGDSVASSARVTLEPACGTAGAIGAAATVRQTRGVRATCAATESGPSRR